MTQLIKRLPPRPILTVEKLDQHDLKRQEMGERCQKVFDVLYPQLKDQYENWFIAIKLDSEHYLLDKELLAIIKKAQQYYQETGKVGVIFRLNETGVCGRI